MDLTAIAAVVGIDHVLTDADLRAGFELDWTGRWRGTTPAVVRPCSTAEVAGVLAACARVGAAVVPQGGNTGLVGGGVPLAGEIVLSMRRLDELGPVDAVAAQVTVGAGATLSAVQSHAAVHGLAVGVDLAARDSATIGGMVATNAGGLHFVRHGSMRAQLVGIEAVLADGGVISHLGGLAKDNTGYDLAGLLAGSEGTLAVVTAVRLKLVPLARARVTALVGIDGAAAAVAATVRLRDEGGPPLEAAELFFHDGLTLVATHLGLPFPFPRPAPAYLLVEWSGDQVPPVVGRLEGVIDVAIGQDSSRRASLWRYREAHTEAANSLGSPPHKLDVTLPLGRLAEFIDDVRRLVSELVPAGRCVLFGHAADGNIHVNVIGPSPDDDTVDDAVMRLVAGFGGSISSEHGIGTAKKAWIHLNRSPAELAVFAAIKAALDPKGILNPNALLPSSHPKSARDQ